MRLHYILLCLSAVSISGCLSLSPSFMPTGYKYHKEDYKSAEGRHAKDVGYDYSHSQNDINMEELGHIARDIILRAKAHGSYIPATFQLKTDLTDSAFSSSYKYSLLEVMRENGSVLSKNSDAPIIFFTVFDPVYKKALDEYGLLEVYNEDAEQLPNKILWFDNYKFDEMYFALAVIEDNKIKTEVVHSYKPPLAGFDRYGYKSPSTPLLEEENYATTH